MKTKLLPAAVKILKRREWTRSEKHSSAPIKSLRQLLELGLIRDTGDYPKYYVITSKGNELLDAITTIEDIETQMENL